jgi:hypothetical protein
VPLSIHTDLTATTCTLSLWGVAEDDAFVRTLARLYLRRPNHARKIILGLQPGAIGFGGSEVDNAIELLRVRTDDIATALASADSVVAAKAEATRKSRLWQRDGLLFQHISWVAGTLQFPAAAAKAPHVRVADKGFDGLFLEVGAAGFTRLVVCEDKATENPRDTVTQSVWPELKDTEAGGKDLELLDAVIALLDTIIDLDAREAVINNTIWAQHRQYRVAVTATAADQKAGSFDHIFDGYALRAPQAQTVRMGEVMLLDDIRQRLQALADRVILQIQEIAASV